MSDEHSSIEPRLIQVGKVKEVYEIPESDQLEFRFTDKISVFDKVIPSIIPRKGESLCRTSAFWFERSAELGVKTHFIELTSPDSMRVKRVRVERDMARIAPDSTSILVPLEFIARYYVAGSLLDRMRKGRIKMEDVGFPHDHVPKYGEPLPEPLFEATTKLEEIDRPVTNEEARELAKLSRDEWDDIVEAVMKVDRFINDQAAVRGMIHVDGKKEFGFDENRELMLLDTFGTADEDRFWDAREYENGNLVELSKEAVRQYYRSSGYHQELMEARDRGIAKDLEPPIPALPESEVRKVADLYREMYERLTGDSF
ncbi:MAG: phosphoribosylaminoimidazolesuccinocarboxamide synthase [Candidatus Thermoplasmatota archaeon]|nr:phosphoribosylaminoimidazolesuccinocarboxamide synthase [Candidatus Thermoplasmatota archaeon]